ncbi:hypothetical protein Moror_392 [Moniliophthora roreri MCA 2997]|uniref:Uncharacterized protein n=1 Tax=Moniliophthora roreri (strain MCA 2997) TaxID=1381753 RepID=V2XZ79_MONRO|nr:hypothetical protein Moror_392 [Moniliophthora roreri MCA 2997]
MPSAKRTHPRSRAHWRGSPAASKRWGHKISCASFLHSDLAEGSHREYVTAPYASLPAIPASLPPSTCSNRDVSALRPQRTQDHDLPEMERASPPPPPHVYAGVKVDPWIDSLPLLSSEYIPDNVPPSPTSSATDFAAHDDEGFRSHAGLWFEDVDTPSTPNARRKEEEKVRWTRPTESERVFTAQGPHHITLLQWTHRNGTHYTVCAGCENIVQKKDFEQLHDSHCLPDRYYEYDSTGTC